MNASSKAKQRYNQKVYDIITITVPKGQKEVIAGIAKAQGYSLSRFVAMAIREKIQTLEQS